LEFSKKEQEKTPQKERKNFAPTKREREKRVKGLKRRYVSGARHKKKKNQGRKTSTKRRGGDGVRGERKKATPLASQRQKGKIKKYTHSLKIEVKQKASIKD